jgi:hypothetical protein
LPSIFRLFPERVANHLTLWGSIPPFICVRKKKKKFFIFFVFSPTAISSSQTSAAALRLIYGHFLHMSQIHAFLPQNGKL